MATIKEVSRLAQVSVATVSRVANGNKWVAEETQARVRAAMAELGYTPNTNARALATNKSDIIGMVVGDLGGPFFGDLMHQVEQEVRRLGKHLIVTSGHGNWDDENDAVEFLLQRQVDALILHVDSLSDEELYALTQRTETPIVLVNRFVPELAAQCVHVNNELGGRLITQHLISQGHRDIACITGPLYKADSRARLQGYRQALEAADIEFRQELVVEGDYTEPGGSLAMERLFRRELSISAVVCGNDLMAYGAIRLAKSHQLSVPRDLSVAGYDNIVMSAYVEPGLTTMHVPIGKMGLQAGQLAVALAAKRTLDVQHEFDPQLVIRESVVPCTQKFGVVADEATKRKA